jgi:hypothetical protein
LATAELFDPGLGFVPPSQPQASLAIPLVGPGSSLVITGSNFRGVSESSGGNGTQDSPADHPVVQVRSLENEQTAFLVSTIWSADSLATVPLINFPPGYAMATLFVNGIPSTSAFLDVSVAGPTVSILSPTNGASFAAGTNLLIGRLGSWHDSTNQLFRQPHQFGWRCYNGRDQYYFEQCFVRKLPAHGRGYGRPRR